MRKLFAFMLAAALTCSLAACGSGGAADKSASSGEDTSKQAETGMTKEEMLGKAELFDMQELYDGIAENKVKAEEELAGKIFTFDGYVGEIESDHIIFEAYNSSYSMKVHLPKDDIINLVTDQKISVVGELTTVGYESKEDFGQPIRISSCESANAYITNDVFEVSGELTFRYLTLRDLDGRIHSQDGQEDKWYFGLTVPDATVETMIVSLEDAIPVTHTPGVPISTITIDGTELKNGDLITISGKMKRGAMIDVKLVSVN
jgi:predicted small lipoprotein YifL